MKTPLSAALSFTTRPHPAILTLVVFFPEQPVPFANMFVLCAWLKF